MKKVLCAILAVMFLIPCIACAVDFGLQGMSYAELLDLRNQINAEITSRPEWKEVIVPQGEWRVGIDIPAGEYSVSYAGKYSNRAIAFQVFREAAGQTKNNGVVYNNVVEAGDPMGRVILKEGYVVVIKNGEAKFAPPILLGF